MPRKVSSLLRSVIKSTPATTTTSSAAAAKTSPALDKSLKNFASPLDASSASTPKHTTVKSHKRPQPSKPPSPVRVSSLFEDGDNGGKPSEDALKVPWFSDSASDRIYLRRKAASRERKQQWAFKKGQVNYVNRLVDSCAVRLGTDASTTDDETVALQQVSKALEVFMSMKEQRFPIEEESYGQVLLYLIDRGMVQLFHLFTDVIKDGNVSTRARLGYYEMLLYTRVNDEEKVQEFCNCFFTSDGDETISLRENYLLALCDNDQKDYLLLLLETVDIKQISSLDHTVSIVQSLGRLSLESHAEKFLLALKECDVEPEDISALVFSYATSIPNETVEDVLLRFKNLMTPSSRSYTKLVKHSCGLSEVHVAFHVVDQMCKADLSLSMDIIHTLLNAIEKSSDFYLVQRIYSLICHYDLKPNMKTFKQLISLSVKITDFDGAYGMLNDLKQLNLAPTAIMYNDIIGGYFREKRFSDVSKVLNQMKLAHVKLAHVKPDSITYAYLKQLQQRRESH